MTKDVAASVRWAGPIAILTVHAMSLGFLYLLLVFIGQAFVDHYNAIGIATTPRFDTVSLAADFLSKYSISFFVFVVVDALMIRWIATKFSRWLSAYSHAYLAIIVFVMFIAFSWMVNPMVWNTPTPGVAPVNQAVVNAN